MHDWGSGLGLHYARQHPGNVKGIVLMESIVAPLMPAESYEALPNELGEFFRTVRDPVNGPKLLIDENYFVEVVLPSFISRDLDQAAHDYYRQPFLEKERFFVMAAETVMAVDLDDTEVIANEVLLTLGHLHDADQGQQQPKQGHGHQCGEPQEQSGPQLHLDFHRPYCLRFR